MECQECITTDCTDLQLQEDNTWYCCYHSGFGHEEMCENCYDDFIISEADMYKDMVNDDLVLGDFDN